MRGWWWWWDYTSHFIYTQLCIIYFFSQFVVISDFFLEFVQQSTPCQEKIVWILAGRFVIINCIAAIFTVNKRNIRSTFKSPFGNSITTWPLRIKLILNRKVVNEVLQFLFVVSSSPMEYHSKWRGNDEVRKTWPHSPIPLQIICLTGSQDTYRICLTSIAAKWFNQATIHIFSDFYFY